MSFDGPRWLDLCVRSAWDDSDCIVRVKAYGFNSVGDAPQGACRVWLELQGLLHSLVPKETAQNMKLSKTLKKLAAKLGYVMEFFGESFADCILPSMRAWPSDEVMSPFCRQEYQISVVGYLALLVGWNTCRHSVQERDMARICFIAFARKVCGPEVFSEVSASRMTEVVLSACPHGSHFTQGVCIHVDELLAKEQTLTGDIGESLWNLVSFLYARANVCGALARWLPIVASALAASAHRGIETQGVDDPLKKATFATTSKGRKRRLDEDYIDALGSAVSSGRATSTSAVARVMGDISSSAANKHDEQFLRAYNAQGHLTFWGAEAVGLTYDAGRLGQPPEETVLFCIERVDRGEAMWLPPQAGPWRHFPYCCSAVLET